MKYHGSHYYATDENIFFFSPINNSSQISNYKTNYFRIPKQYSADDIVQQFRVIQPMYIQTLPEYLYFDCPQLTSQNYVDTNGKIHNIIAKALNNSQGGQFFVMTTTEALKILTL